MEEPENAKKVFNVLSKVILSSQVEYKNIIELIKDAIAKTKRFEISLSHKLIYIRINNGWLKEPLFDGSKFNFEVLVREDGISIKVFSIDPVCLIQEIYEFSNFEVIKDILFKIHNRLIYCEPEKHSSPGTVIYNKVYVGK